MSELKPCPFCGGKAEISQFGDYRKSTLYSCLECGCKLETNEEFNHGKDWNNRTTKEMKTETRYLPVCAEVGLCNFINRGSSHRRDVKEYQCAVCDPDCACTVKNETVKVYVTYKIEVEE